MEFPGLGKHCSENSCKQLDFLPMKCDACYKIFCKDHVQYEKHRCTESYKKDNQVPVCPLCNKPIPVMPNQVPDVAVNQHIDTDCQSDPAKEKRGKVYSNRCSYKGCKQRELVPVSCDKCHKNYCLRHRHESDHNCQGFEGSGRGVSKAASAAVARQQNAPNKKPQSTGSKFKHDPKQTVLTGLGRELDSERRGRAQNSTGMTGNSTTALQAGMSEDEAFARAIQLSMAEGSQSQTVQHNKPTSKQEEDDLALAQAIAASEEEERRQRQRRQPTQRQRSQESEKSSCEVS